MAVRETANSEAKIVVEQEDGVGWIVFDNVARHNAMTTEMTTEIVRATEHFAADDSIRVVVLRGAGDRAFSAGVDLKNRPANKPVVTGPVPDLLPPIDKPVIAMIHGTCIGGGLVTALEADIRIAADDARFGIPVARLGGAYRFEDMRRLVELVGRGAASMLTYTSDVIGAHEALRIGLVNLVVAKADLEATVLDLAHRIAKQAPLSLRASKATIRTAVSGSQPEDVERCRQMIAACRLSDDAVEGRTAFLEKREPRFQGS